MTRRASNRGMLYSPLPDYDVFKGPREETRTDELETADELETTDEPDLETTEDTSAPVMARANWTGTVPADD